MHVRARFWALAFLFCAAAVAQQAITGASLRGEVRDPTGAAVPGLSISVTNLGTNQSWSILTDESGRFRFQQLPSGSYRLTTVAPGFAPYSARLELALGQAFDLRIPLKLASETESVSIVEESPMIELARTQIAESVSSREIADLPLNGRNYLDLALLVPGVSRTNTGAAQRFAETSAVPGTGISVHSQRNLNNSFLVDGLSANDDAAELAGMFFSQEVVREFQVVTSGAAEFGRASSGVVNILTQSGGNQLRGKAYGFLRNQRLDARHPLAAEKLPLTQAQYGLGLGGPIIPDRTFYFANFEQSRQNTSGLITISPANVSTINSRLDIVGHSGPRIFTGAFPSTLDTTNFFARVDHAWSPRMQSALRYSFYDVESRNARNAGGLNALSRGADLKNRDHNIALNNIWNVSPRTLVQSRFQYTHSWLAAPVNDEIGPAVNIAGVASFGTATFSPTGRNIDMFETVNDVSWSRGRHSLKAGFDYLHDRVKVTFPGALQGVYNFRSLAFFNTGVYENFQQAFGTSATSQENPNLGMFVTDEWKPLSTLTLNAGLRYDLQFIADPIATDTNNVSPRIGLAWDPLTSGSTVVRANYGLFYDTVPLRAVSNALQRDGVNYRVAQVTPATPGAPIFPNVMSAFPIGILTNITTMDREIESSYTHQSSLQIEQALNARISLAAAYTHLRGYGLIMSRNLNVPTTTNPSVFNLGRPNPNHANNSQFQSIGDSWYDGLTVSLNHHPREWGSFRVSYTFSKALDTAGNFFFSTPQDNSDIASEKGRSDNDQRHRLSVSGLVTPPAFVPNRAWHAVTSGWQFGYIYAYTSALPFNIQTGTDRNGDTNNNDRPLGFGRNTGAGFAFQSLDLRVSRTFALHERWKLETMIEAFNALNQRNDQLPNNTFGPGSTPRPSFGLATAAGDPRQVQLGLRLSF